MSLNGGLLHLSGTEEVIIVEIIDHSNVIMCIFFSRKRESCCLDRNINIFCSYN